MKKTQLIILSSTLSMIAIFGWYFLLSSNYNTHLSYNQDIQPILAAKCYTCHGPDKTKIKAGLRVDIRDSLFVKLESGNTALDQYDFSESELIRRISSADPDYMMPPPDAPKQLDAEEVLMLSQWVEAGAQWENHWSYEPIKEREVSKVSKAWSENPIDAFVLSKQEKLGLQHSPEADKRTLIRRLTYDLHGLPPSPEQIEEFLADDSPEAYANLVDKLLESPRFGERWARHWLDVAHYGETHGYDKDKRRENAWPYRDYVINAYNQDIPYSRFIEDQIAGDVLYPDDPQSTVALGFLAAGPWDFVGHVEVFNGTKDKRIVRNLDRDDIVSSVMGTFSSLTVQCARCHDHKFDLIEQKDYYSLQSVFAGIDRADRPFDEDPVIHQNRLQLKQEKQKWESQLDVLGEKLGEKEQQEITDIQAKQKVLENKIAQLKRPKSKNFGYHSAVEQLAGKDKWILLDLGRTFDLDKIVLVPSHPSEGIPMPGYGFPLRYKVEVSTNSNFSPATTIIDFSKEDHHERTDRSYTIEIETKGVRYISLSANKLWRGRGTDHFLAMAEILAYADGNNVARNAQVKVSDTFSDKRWNPNFVTDGFNSYHLIDGELLPAKVKIELDKTELELTALQNQENKVRRSVLEEMELEKLDRIRIFLVDIEDSLQRLPTPSFVYAAATEFNDIYQFTAPDSIRTIHRLDRGDTEQPREEVFPGTVASFEGLLRNFDLNEGHSEGERRAALAKWMTDSRNALTWRSIVNRIWQYHFGKGIVATPNDFGKMGRPPSNPELLDYLVQEFLDHGQSLKWLHQLIVTSSTYKQQTTHNAENHLIDSENTYLWRANRRQLEAEAVRDAVLAVSGKLDLRMGGPGFDAFRYEDDHSPRYVYKDYDAEDLSSFRRAIYRFVVRSMPDPFMSTLDCADPSQSVPVRNETVTALQALSVLNNPFMVRQSAYFAARLQLERKSLDDQISRGFELALQRLPEKNELSELNEYASKHGLPATCRLIFAMNEFLYVD
ncbi:MAG: PSD1 and planctomycete cytochrome C domain-containing protein [Bacteroidetes bacterium]|nr:PSD1 and planctomycete cytochrome C domain-containing protein [Bacteroidota bacterium]MDA1122371.1 PSD1 and planctomycete cytochrome C domain-containing protein [Bacteroidota bacterium]